MNPFDSIVDLEFSRKIAQDLEEFFFTLRLKTFNGADHFYLFPVIPFIGATTFSIKTFSIMTFSIMTFSITTFSI
jgi:hypothetical protein